MKATLEYYLPDDDGAFKMACRSFDYHSALWDLQQLVREYEKYETMGIDTFMDRVKDILYDVILDDIP